MHRLSWLLFLATFFLNPAVACGPADPDFKYGATEMRAAVEGTWTFVIAPEGGASPLELTAKVEQAAPTGGSQARNGGAGRALIRRAEACGTRTLVKSANACIDLTEMPLAVTYLSGNETFTQAKLSGVFIIYSLVYHSAASTSLSFALGGYDVTARLAPDGTLVDARVAPGGLPGTLVSAGRK